MEIVDIGNGAFKARTRLKMSRQTETPSLVEIVRAACLNDALAAYEDAGIRGLCTEGRWEAAVAAIRDLDLSGVLEPPPDSAHVHKRSR